VRKLNTPFYLTGGTALSRHYFHHRFSDDLDLFLNHDTSYNRYVENIFSTLEENQSVGNYFIDYQRLRKEENYAQFFLTKKAAQENIDVELKIDLVNDVASHYGDFEHSKTLGLVDSWRNILSNKLSALFRYEAKDFVDIWIIAKSKTFHWKEIIPEAKTKEVGVDPIAIFEILKSFPSEVLSSVKWNIKVDEKVFISELSTIADDIFYGNENNLSKVEGAD
jgi:predicted nucleotidyltransferase component of viral defense system